MPRPRSNRSAAGKSPGKSIEAQRHEQDTRINIPTAEYQSMVEEDTEAPLRVAYQRRNRDLDPQLVWRGKDEQDVGDLVVNVPPLYIQEKVHPKVLIDDLVRQSRNGREPADYQIDMFADFNGLPEGADRTEFYQHDGYWQNRMVLGDSLQVMASLSDRRCSTARCPMRSCAPQPEGWHGLKPDPWSQEGSRRNPERQCRSNAGPIGPAPA